MKDVETFDQNTDSLFRKEAAELDGLGEPLRTERHRLHGMLLETASLTTDNALDHIRALEHDILRQPPPVWSPLMLNRVVMVGVLFSEYLFDPTIPLIGRLARLAGIWRTDATYAQKQAEAHGQEPAEAGQMPAYVEAALQKCQATEWHNRQGKLIGYSFGSESAPFLDINITERAVKAMPDWLPAPYRLTSGEAHNRPWVIGRAKELAGGDGLAGEAATVMAAVMVTLGAVEVVVSVVLRTRPLSFTDVSAVAVGWTPREKAPANRFAVAGSRPLPMRWVLAVWGVPVARVRCALLAARWALARRRTMAHSARRWARRSRRMRVRSCIGLAP
ncbi:hypothetical protein [Streptomyces phaeochromogenes]